MQCNNKLKRSICLALVFTGDVGVFFAFIILGKADHDLSLEQALVRTALPFASVWVVSAALLGAYKSSALNSLNPTVWKIPLIWLSSGLIALLGRALLTDAPLILSFTVVSIAVQGGLLISWRIIVVLAISKLVDESPN